MVIDLFIGTPAAIEQAGSLCCIMSCQCKRTDERSLSHSRRSDHLVTLYMVTNISINGSKLKKRIHIKVSHSLDVQGMAFAGGLMIPTWVNLEHLISFREVEVLEQTESRMQARKKS